MKKIRYGLLRKAQEAYRSKLDLEVVDIYLKSAFTFVTLNIHRYPNYVSEPIKIWMENSGKIDQRVKFDGEDLYMI